MKKSKHIIAFFLALTFIVSGGITTMAGSEPVSPESMHSKGISPITGTFIQPWLYNAYSAERWDKEFEMMKELGIEYIIMGDTLSCSTGEPITDTSKWVITADYATANPSFRKGNDVLTPLFERCKKYGMKLYVGMGNTPAGWPFFDYNTTGFVEIAEMFAEVAEDLYNVYYTAYPETFAGFYFVPEMYNSSTFDYDYQRSTYVKNLGKGFHIIFDKLTSLNPDLPFIFSPYVNMFGGSWVSKNPEKIGLFWKELLETAGFRDGDILCPQDSVGAGGNDLNLLEDVTKAYRYAVDNCGLDIKLWSNCEIFVQPTDKFYDNYDGVGYWSACTTSRMVSQFEIVSKYVDRIFCFAVPHYLSPYNNVHGYYDSYMYYLKNGKLEDEAPIPPDTFRTTFESVNGKKVLTVYWSGMYDNIGVHRVNIYKDGELYTYRISTRNEGHDGTESYPNKFWDLDFTEDTKNAVTYEFEVIDCAGNVSERSTFTVEPGSVPNKVKLTETYTGPIPAGTSLAEGAKTGAKAAKRKPMK